MNILLSIIFIYIKFISVTFSMIIICAKIEAYYIINEKSYKLKDGYTNNSIFPPYIDSSRYNTKLSDLLYLKYKLFVFDIAYNNVRNNNTSVFKLPNIKTIAKLFFLYAIGINRFSIIIIGLFVNFFKDCDYESILITYFSNTYDSRKLIKINNTWVANNPKDYIKKILNNIFENSKTPLSMKDEYNLDITKISKKLKCLDFETRVYVAPFVNKEFTTKTHKIFLEATNNNSLAIETDFDKSIKNDNYNKTTLINRYLGDKKISTLLEQNSFDMEQTNKEYKVKFINQLRGALDNGYDYTILSEKYNKHLQELIHVNSNIDVFIKKYNLNIQNSELFKIIESNSIINIEDL